MSKNLDRSKLDALAAGYYILTKDVKNPVVDKRFRNQILGMAIIPKGTRFQVSRYAIRNAADTVDKDERVDLKEYGGLSIAIDTAIELAPFLQPAMPVLGHFLNNSSLRPVSVLLMLVEQGKVTLDDVKTAGLLVEAIPYETQTDQDAYDKRLSDNWVDCLGL